MKSTGEVMGLDASFERAFAKSQLGAGVILPEAGTVFLSIKDADKKGLAALARRLTEMGFAILATRGTAGAHPRGRVAGARWSTRCWRAGRTASTRSAPARSSW